MRHPFTAPVAVSTDIELLTAWRAGDATAGERLFRRHFAAIARFFRNKVTGDLEDLIQQTFLGCLEGRDRFRGDGSFRGYVFGVAHRVLGTYLRHKYRERGVVDLADASLDALDPSPSLMFARRREHQALLLALRQLPIPYQLVLELYYWEEMTAAAIAAALEIPLGTAQTRLQRARHGLAHHYERLAAATGASTASPDFEGWAREIRGDAAVRP